MGNNEIYYHNAPRYWIRAMTFVPYFWNEKEGEKISSHVKTFKVSTEVDATVIVTVLNSNLFSCRFLLLSNCRDLSSRENKNFPLGIDKMNDIIKKELIGTCKQLMEDYKDHSVRKEAKYLSGKVVYDEFYPRHSKLIINKIDEILEIIMFLAKRN